MSEGTGTGPRPRARREDVLVEVLGDETLIYDVDQHRAHCLNEAAAIVWRHADGSRTIAELGTVLDEAGSEVPGADAARYTVEQLHARGLLEGEVGHARTRGEEARIGRRELLRKVAVRGVMVGLAIPVISSIASPTPAQAFSCSPTGSGCSSSAQCCSGICFGGFCL